ncbi:MAG: hypothetical protein KGZ66_07880 [Selenomonadales bacterium]|nr:hypothetical protein [Selenomonadales bacterium]
MIRPTTRELLYGALLTAISLLIPLAFRGFLQIVIPPFSATLGSHVAVMLAMFVSPSVAAAVGIGSTLGFLITLTPVIAARASIHIVFGVLGALLYQRGAKPWQVFAVTAPVHALGEALVVIPFGYTLQAALVLVGVGTLLHHVVDAVIALSLYHSLRRAGVSLSARHAPR